jgi:hypothetical protein
MAIRLLNVRVRAEALEHDLNRRDVDHRLADRAEMLIVLAQAPIARVPREGPFDHPPPGLDNESFLAGESLNDLEFQSEDVPQIVAKVSTIGLISPDLEQRADVVERREKQIRPACQIRPSGRVHQHPQQIPQGVDEDVPFAPPRIFFPRRIRVPRQPRSSSHSDYR